MATEIILLFSSVFAYHISVFKWSLPLLESYYRRVFWLGRDLQEYLVLTPLPLSGTPPTRPNCSISHPTWPWALSGVGHPQFLCSSASPQINKFLPNIYHRFHRITEYTEYAELEETHKDYQIQLLALRRTIPYSGKQHLCILSVTWLASTGRTLFFFVLFPIKDSCSAKLAFCTPAWLPVFGNCLFLCS